MPYRAPELFDIPSNGEIRPNTDGAARAALTCVTPGATPCAHPPPLSLARRVTPTVWSLACTLYAMMYGYSPFECEFREDGSARVVECSHLRVLGAVRFPPVRNRYALGSQALLHVPRGWHLALMWTHTRVALCWQRVASVRRAADVDAASGPKATAGRRAGAGPSRGHGRQVPGQVTQGSRASGVMWACQPTDSA